jgi:multidrug efflux pump subunit AcrB
MSFPNLSALAVKQRSVTLFFLLLSVIAGIYAFTSMGRAEDPAFTVRAMTVQAYWPGATAEQLQDQVVDRLEKRIQEVEYIYRIDTTIRPGFASILVEFHEYSPAEQVNELFYEVRKRMLDEQANLPAGVVGPIVIDDFNDVYFSLIALTGDNAEGAALPLRELTREAEAIRDRLQRVPGVHKALLLGERAERVYVEFDPAGLINLGIEPTAIFNAIQQHNQLLPAGRIETQGARLHIRVDSLIDDPQQLAQLPIATANGIVSLGDIATIRRGYEEPARYLIRSRGEDALLLGVVMQKGYNGQELGENLGRFVAAEEQQLPLGISLEVITDQSDAINKAVGLFQVKFLVAVGVVMLVSILAIGFRAGVIVGLAVPLTLGITFMVMLLLGINLDRITLGALILALGLLVDDAIIAVEMMLVKIHQGWNSTRAASHAWTVTAAPMLFGTLVTVAGFFPIGFAKSGVGEYAGNIFWVTGIALIVSWLVAVIFVPYLGVRLIGDKPPSRGAHGDGEEAYNSQLYQKLRAVIQRCVKNRKTVVVATIALLVLSIVGMATLVQKQFFPNSDRTEVIVSVYMPQGTSIQQTDAVVQRLEDVINQQDNIRSVASYVGGGPPRFFISASPEPMDPAFAKIVAVTADEQSRNALMALLQEQIEQGAYSEARVRVYRLLYGPPVNWPITFRVLGPDPDQLRVIGHQVREVVAQHPNTHNTHLEWDERIPVYRLNLDANALQLHGLTPIRLAEQLQLLVEGTPITELYEDIRQVAVQVRGREDGAAIDPQRFASLEVLNAQGDRIPLSQLGELEVAQEEPVIRRYNRENYVNVLADVRGAQPNTLTSELWQQIESIRAALPLGYSMQIGGSVEQSNKGEGSLQKLQPIMVAFMLIFIMLQMRSFSGTFMVFATAPLGLIGAVLALLLFNQPFGFVALLGLTGLAGILMRNTLILTQQVSDNLADGMQTFAAIVEAAVQRARPVILTALAAMLAFVPLTQDSFWGPLAYVLIGGVGVGTVITLLFVPALYALWYRVENE